MTSVSLKQSTVVSKAKSKSEIEKSKAEFDQWLQRKYLPEKFQWNDHEVKLETRKRCFRKLKFDLKELLHGFSILILIIWILALIILGFYAEDQCSLLVQHHLKPSENSSPTINKVHNATSALNLNMSTFNDSTSTESLSFSTLPFRRSSIMHRLKHLEASDDKSHHASNCIIESTFVLSNFALASLMTLYLFVYLFHIVEMAPEFPWFAIEISCAVVYMLHIFGLTVAICITSHQDLFVILAIVQLICIAFFILSRYDQYKSGLSPQNSETANGNDYFRTVKNIFNLAGSKEEFSKRSSIQKCKQANEVSKRQATSVKSKSKHARASDHKA